MDWKPIETAPTDGSEIMVRRVIDGRIAFEGTAVFDTFADAAPIRSSMPPDPLGRPLGDGAAGEDVLAARHWLKPDRLYRFPEPTHWMPKAP